MLIKAPKLPRHDVEQRRLAIVQGILSLAAIAALALLVADYGFYLTPQQHAQIHRWYWGIAALFVAGAAAQLLIAQYRRSFLRINSIKYLLTAVMLVELLTAPILLTFFPHVKIFPPITIQQVYSFFLQLYILFVIIRAFARFSQQLSQYNTSPARFIVLSFGTAIAIGTALLLTPKATTSPLAPLDALFTATSAVCVTGLIVVDTATAFTRTGQCVIMALIQFGGLGIMTVTAFFSLMINQQMSGREQVLMGNVLSADRPAQLSTIIRAVFWMTVAIETIGLLVLYSAWNDLLPPDIALYTALFHAISAFCNAGFSTFSDSLMSFSMHIRICMMVMVLIILGGLGFETLRNFVSFVYIKGFQKKKQMFRFSVQTKIVLIMTAGLILIGSAGFFWLEQHHTLTDLPVGGQLLNAGFQAITFRTAGFNTVDFALVSESSLFLGILWMFIGAAPGSTGGGIKVTTLAILLGTVYASSRGKSRLELFHRTIPVKVLYQTLVVITVYLSVAVLVSFLLSITEPDGRPIAIIFETVSALGTVGLSTGLTPLLSTTGKSLIILTMFLGRIGPFTLALAIAQKQLTESYSYPEEEVQIG